MSNPSSAILTAEVRERLVQKFGEDEARKRERAAKASVFAVPKKKFRCEVAQTVRRTGFVVIEADNQEEAANIAQKPGALADALWEDEEEKGCDVNSVEEIIAEAPEAAKEKDQDACSTEATP